MVSRRCLGVGVDAVGIPAVSAGKHHESVAEERHARDPVGVFDDGIVDRPVAVAGEVVIRPMMYVALTYDHRVVDGREAVSFLKKVKDLVEDPARLVLEI